MNKMSLEEVWSYHNECEAKRQPYTLEEIMAQQETNKEAQRTNTSSLKPIMVSNMIWSKVNQYCDKNKVNFNEVVEVALDKYINR